MYSNLLIILTDSVHSSIFLALVKFVVVNKGDDTTEHRPVDLISPLLVINLDSVDGREDVLLINSPVCLLLIFITPGSLSLIPDPRVNLSLK